MPTDTALPNDLLRPFQLERSQLRGRFVRLGDTVDYVLRAHDYPAPVSDLLGELLLLAGGLAGGLKFDGSFSLQIRGDGPVGLMVADCTNNGRMRGYASFDAERVAATEAAEPARLVGKGILALTVDQAASGGETYQGIVELDGRSLSDSMLAYFRQSEQIPTGIRTALGRDPLTGAWRAGAIILQATPGSGPEAGDVAEDDWRRAMVLLQTASEAELLDLSPDDLLWRLFHEEGVRVFEPLGLQAGCSCDEERVVNVLRSFDAGETEEMRLPDGSISVTCQFCSRSYHFEPKRLATLLGDRIH
ncbi:MAG TPA: Hsp33 family molecular chaperone HslO [Geminicoccaceae bacterium]|nr:Hsp33 family molecular chaperone HslO [Geminicoccus sp.]HMU48225.1 Hsp33 family molecular chaperone HslO [Geminicoccaceae bacterium]